MSLAQLLQHHIQQQPHQRIPFVEFMDWVLYHPQSGYYSQGAGLGKSGDFFTASHLGSDLGELLAEQFVDCWHHLDRPEPFSLLEMGAGQGFLAADILQWIRAQYPDCWRSLQYLIVERSPGLRQKQQYFLQPLFNAIDSSTSPPSITWVNWSDIADDSLIGCCFSNELVDAFPVHQVIAQGGELQEVYVRWIGEQWQEEYDRPSTPRLLQYFEALNLNITQPPYPDPYRTEVNIAAQDWLTTLSHKLHRGYVITIDYGYDNDRYHHPQRDQGTLQCYRNHQRHNNPYLNLGTQDITTHVNFTVLQQWGKDCGLETIGFTRQALFLMALGLGDRLQQLTQDPQNLPTLLQRRDALHQLLDPAGLGNFGVLIQAKGLQTAAEKALRGLREPVNSF